MMASILGRLLRLVATRRGVSCPPRPGPGPAPDWVRPRSVARLRARVLGQAPTGHPPVATPSRIAIELDPDRPYEISPRDGLLIQRGAVDVLLADGRMSRLGLIASYDPDTREPRHISYVPIHELAESEVVP